jgi:hypothetical protein
MESQILIYAIRGVAARREGAWSSPSPVPMRIVIVILCFHVLMSFGAQVRAPAQMQPLFCPSGLRRYLRGV